MYILHTSFFLIRYVICKYFYPICGLSFILLVSFKEQSCNFNFSEVQLIKIFFLLWIFFHVRNSKK